MKAPRSLTLAIEEVASKLRSERDKYEHERAAWAKSKFTGLVARLANQWRSDNVPKSRSPRTIEDPLYGRISFDSAISTVLAHPLVQRLHRIKQLSFCFTEYPSSTHSRFSHSVGTARNAELAVRGILDRREYFIEGGDRPQELGNEILLRRDDLIRKASLAALLHDLGHGPFGHALDSYIGFKDISGGSLNPKPDKKYTRQYIRQYLAPTLKAIHADPEEIAKLLDPAQHVNLDGFEHLIADIVDSPLDVDRMDYLLRDAHHTGLSMGSANTVALLDSMRAVKVEGQHFTLAFDEAALGHIEHFLMAREAMFFHCYEHPRKKAAERAFTKLIKLLLDDPSLGLLTDDLFLLTDEEVITVVKALDLGSEEISRLLDALVSDVDYEVIHETKVSAVASKDGRAWLEETLPKVRPELQAELREIMRNVRGITLARELPNGVRSWVDQVLGGGPAQQKNAYIDTPNAWEEEIAAKSIGAESKWKIQVIVPSHEVRLIKQSATKLLSKSTGQYQTVDLFDRSSTMKEIVEHFNDQRNRIRVMVPAHLSPEEIASVKRAAIDVLG